MGLDQESKLGLGIAIDLLIQFYDFDIQYIDLQFTVCFCML